MEFWRVGGLLVPASLHDSTTPTPHVFISVSVLCSGLLGRWSLAIGNSPKALVASPGFAPDPPVSETGALLIMQRGISKIRSPNAEIRSKSEIRYSNSEGFSSVVFG